MKHFNAFQTTAMFAAWPFLIAWLGTAEFFGAVALYWVAIAAYVIGFLGIASCVLYAFQSE